MSVLRMVALVAVENIIINTTLNIYTLYFEIFVLIASINYIFIPNIYKYLIGFDNLW